MPMSVINDYLQLGLAEYEGWDTGYLSYAMAPVENVLEAASIPIQTQEEEEAQAAREQEKLDESKQGGVDGIRRLLAQRNGDGGGAAFQASRPKRHRQIWLAKMAAQRKTERAYESGFNRVLMKARAETLQRLSAMGAGKSGNGSVQRAVGDIVFDLANFKLSLWLVFKTLNRKAMDDAGQQVMDELDVDDPWTTPQVEVLQFNRTRENKIVGAAEEVFRQVNDTINDGLEAGKSVAELTTDVRSAFNGISRGRAKTIARTETGAAYGQGADVAMEQAGVQFKQWVASGLDDVRPAHQEADGQVVKMSESYDVGGEALRFPGDPTGSAGNVINCRCVSIAVPTSEGI
jgi:SPP1 gp7 family putative phage head morphogenesis protein